MTNTALISKSFNRHACEYEKVAKVQKEIGERLLERLQYLKIKPKRILDLGCGTGIFSLALKRLYPDAQIVGLDLAQQMLKQARKKQGWRRRWGLVTGDMNRLPFADGIFDLVFANQVVHWGSSLPHVFRELNRIMHVNGCLMFTTLGPDTFKELKAAWASIDAYQHTHTFADMHDVGDQLLQEYFLDPVVDMELITVCYKSISLLLNSLKDQGVLNINTERNHGLTGKTAWKKFNQHFNELYGSEEKYPLTYEVVYGHAWKGAQQQTERGIETRISVSEIKRIRS